MFPMHRITVGGDELRLRVPSAATGGALLAVEVHMPAGGGPPVLHRHAAAEVYRVEHGTLAVYVANEGGAVARVEAGPGAVVPIPGGRAHTVRNESGADARAYVVFAPGTEMERFVRAVGGLRDGASMDAVLAIAAEHGVELGGPVPAVSAA